MFPAVALLMVIAALTLIVAIQTASSIRAKREFAKLRKESAEVIVALIAAAEVEMDKRVKKVVSTAIDVTMKALLPADRLARRDVLTQAIFGTPFGPRDRFVRTNNRPTERSDPFSIESLLAALDVPSMPRRYAVGARFGDLAREAARVRPEDVQHIKSAGSADPLADAHRSEFGVGDNGAAVPLTETDPVERTAAHQVAGDGGVATEAEANAESQATPLPPDYAKTHNEGDEGGHSFEGDMARHRGRDFGRRRSSITVESADRPERG